MPLILTKLKEKMETAHKIKFDCTYENVIKTNIVKITVKIKSV